MQWWWAIAAALVSGAASAQGTLERRAQVIHPEEWLGPEHYPPAALRAGEQGRVVVAVDVDADGKPSGCRVSEPGNLPILESSTCQAVMSGGEFAPALDRRGRPVTSTLIMPVRWVIPVSPVAPTQLPVAGPIDFAWRLSFAADDQVLSCESRIDGRPLPMPANVCATISHYDPAKLRAQAKLVGPFSIATTVSTRFGDTPPPLPAASWPGKELLVAEVRQHLDANGKGSGCEAHFTGELAARAQTIVPADPCVSDPRLRDAIDKMGTSHPQHMLLVTRMTLLPAPN
ncbi:TonB family protein [Sphingomonas sp. LR60]|uniref:TonB family protein n=1 Tax=Sphingomonas sp. LR60 TaxID=3050233 RepID=UPI002FE0FAB4